MGVDKVKSFTGHHLHKVEEAIADGWKEMDEKGEKMTPQKAYNIAKTTYAAGNYSVLMAPLREAAVVDMERSFGCAEAGVTQVLILHYGLLMLVVQAW
ncbi:hypothetical protein AAVH_03258 [Aphelenchoides avenae]|nr:hypothetical protein AAVH_03258 [Aphelenchus avenae]